MTALGSRATAQSNRPPLFQMQRNIEAVRAVQQIFTGVLQSANRSWRPVGTVWDQQLTGPIPTVIYGTSMGGAISIWSALLFPEDFHGACSFWAGPSARTWVGEEATADYLSSLSGFGMEELTLSNIEMLQFSAVLWGIKQLRPTVPGIQNWRPFFHASAVRGWKDDFLRRPIYMNITDEDFVTQGMEAIPWISGQQKFQASGRSAPNQKGAQIVWSWVGKNCHQATKPFEYPGQNGPVTYDAAAFAILDFLHEVSAAPAPFPAVTSTENESEDLYEHFLQPTVAATGPFITTAPLQLDAQFSTGVPGATQSPGKLRGNGTRLGMHDSMLVTAAYVTPGSEGDPTATELFTGSAEGVVTRWAVNAATDEVEPLAASEALGHGAWALAIAEENGAPNKEIVVATHRGLHILQRETLVTLATRRNLPWDMGQPLAMQVADVVPGGYSEIIVLSFLGRLQIFDSSLSELFTYGEPGIVDFKVVQTGEAVRLAVLTSRGHVVLLEWNTAANPPTMRLLASSPRLNGTPIDMEFCDAIAGEPALAVLMRETHDKHDESIWVLRATDLLPLDHQVTNQFEVVPIQMDPNHGNGADLEVFDDGSGNNKGFVMLQAQQIVAVQVHSLGGSPHNTPSDVKRIPLAAFPPLLGAVDLAVDNANQRLFVSTEAGYVCWIPLSDLAPNTPTLSFASTDPRPGGRGWNTANAAPAHCNRTTSATWGMCVDNGKLEVIDQAGTRQSIDGSGNVKVVSEVGHGQVSIFNVPVRGPFRGLKKLDGLTVAQTGEALLGTLPPPSPLQTPFLAPATTAIQTAPYEPGAGTGASWKYDEQAQLTQPLPVWRSQGTPAITHNLYIYDGFVVFQRGGDVLSVAGPHGATRQVCWWCGDASLSDAWPNRVQGAWCNASAVKGWWSSAGGVNVAMGSITELPGNQIKGHDLRNQVTALRVVNDAEAIRLFVDPLASEARVALFTPGARLIVLQPGQDGTDVGLPPKEYDSVTQKILDFGTGGMAIAVGIPRNNAVVDIYLGSQAFFAKVPAGAVSEPLVSAITRVEYNCAANFIAASLTMKEQLVLDRASLGSASPAHDVYGVCGMALGELVGNNSGPELVVGALDGHLLVYHLDQLTGVIQTPPLYATQIEGAVGVYNSIVIGDLTGAAPGSAPDGINELYVAGSLGLRRWR